jgi:branched-chain amino acid transport system permease protein
MTLAAPDRAPSSAAAPASLTSARGRWMMVRWLAVALVALAPLLLGSFRLQLFTEALSYALLAMSLDLLLGVAGMPSLGQALYFGVGAYAAGLLALHFTPNLFAGLLFGGVFAAAAAVATGWFVVRSKATYLIMLTLAIGEIGATIATSWESVTGGDQGLVGMPASTLWGSYTVSSLTHLDVLYLISLALVVAVYGGLRTLMRSPAGVALQGVRDNENRMRALGCPVVRYKLAAFALAGAIAGLGGALHACYSETVTPDDVGFSLSALVLVMVLIGGVGTIWGPIVGAVFVIIVRDELSTNFQQWEALIGAIFIAFVYLAPAGVAGFWQRIRQVLRRIRL